MPAAEAQELGMVSRVVPRADLDSAAQELAADIAGRDPFALAQAKRAVNLTMDVIGEHAALESVFDIHWTGHSHALSHTSNRSAALVGLEAMRRTNTGGSSR